jgi:hypothetical protein
MATGTDVVVRLPRLTPAGVTRLAILDIAARATRPT